MHTYLDEALSTIRCHIVSSPLVTVLCIQDEIFSSPLVIVQRIQGEIFTRKLWCVSRFAQSEVTHFSLEPFSSTGRAAAAVGNQIPTLHSANATQLGATGSDQHGTTASSLVPTLGILAGALALLLGGVIMVYNRHRTQAMAVKYLSKMTPEDASDGVDAIGKSRIGDDTIDTGSYTMTPMIAWEERLTVATAR